MTQRLLTSAQQERYTELVIRFVKKCSPKQMMLEGLSVFHMNSGKSVLNIPEECGYNSFISLMEDIQESLGFNVLAQNLCIDAPHFEPSSILHPFLCHSSSPLISVVHLHWPEKLVRQVGISVFLSWLNHLKQEGSKIVLTLHNLKPHEKLVEESGLEKKIWDLADVLHVFSHNQAEHVRQICRYEKDVLVAPHPNYKTTISKEHLIKDKRMDIKRRLREKYGLNPEVVTFVLAGRIRAYKNIQFLIDGIKKFQYQKSQFLIAGNADDLESVNLLLNAASADLRIKLNLKFLSEEEYDEILFLGDFALLPYFSPWSSGFAVRASNLCLPLVGYMPEMFDYPQLFELDFGILAHTRSCSSFVEALSRASSIPIPEILEMGDRSFQRLTITAEDVILSSYQTIYEVVLKNAKKN